MKSLKKWATFLLVQVVAIGTLGGCSQPSTNQETPTSKEEVATEATEDKKNEKPMEISIAHWDIEEALSAGADDKVLTTLEEKFNVKFVPMNITWDDYTQKIQLWAASGSLPDIFSIDAIGTAYYNDWTAQGVVKALPEDLSGYPNLQKYLDVEDIQALKINNQLYCVPRKTYPDNYWNAIDRIVLYRWDLAQKAGVTKEPATWEEFIDMMVKIIEADPEGKNISGLTATQATMIDGFLFPYSLPAAMSDGSGSDYKWVEKDGQYIPAYFAGDAVSTFKLAREMYEKGIIEKDIALTKVQQAQDKFLQGQSAAMLRGGGVAGNYESIGKHWQEVYPDGDYFEDVKVLHLLPSKDGNTYFPIFRTSWSESYIAGSVNDEKLNKILEIYDYLVSREGQYFINYGFEGEDYTVTDGKVEYKNIDEFRDKYRCMKTLPNLVQWEVSVYDDTLPTTVPEECRQQNMAIYKEAKAIGTIPEFDMRYTYLSTPLKNKFVIKPAEDLLNIMMGTEPVEDMYNQLLKDYEAKGLSSMIKEVNDTAKELGW